MRYFLEIAYKGTNYVGWQIQPNGVSVQQKVDEALQTILRDEINCLGCGRTDSGVHAEQFFLHFDTEKEFPANFILRINQFLPNDISAKRVIPVPENAHARFDATLRAYEYRITFEKNVFQNELMLYKHIPDLDFELMEKACGILYKYNDFHSFCKSKQGSKTTIVNIKEVYWRDEAGTKILYISADRFLRGMVRLIVGAMIQIGKYKMTLDEFETGIKNKERFKMAMSAPAQGLFLVKVEYPYLS
ncbi:MAG: tRNA pseudouridine(38-40) synthase TruA [Chitinophagales bacterium]